jgi:hypothetical protein
MKLVEVVSKSIQPLKCGWSLIAKLTAPISHFNLRHSASFAESTPAIDSMKEVKVNLAHFTLQNMMIRLSSAIAPSALHFHNYRAIVVVVIFSSAATMAANLNNFLVESFFWKN